MIADCDLRFAIEIKSHIANRKLQIMPSASRDIIVSNKLGLHARPAMQFVDLANQFKSDIKVTKFGDEPGLSLIHI